MKKLIIKYNKYPIFYKRLNKNQRKVWQTIKTVIALLYFQNDQERDISPIVSDLADILNDGKCCYIIRYISTTKNIINTLEHRILELDLECYRYPIKIGFECLLVISCDLMSLKPLIDWWASADDFDIFIVEKELITFASNLFKSDGSKNTNSVYHEVTCASNIVLRKSGDEEELEILSNKIDFRNINKSIFEVSKKNKIDMQLELGVTH